MKTKQLLQEQINHLCTTMVGHSGKSNSEGSDQLKRWQLYTGSLAIPLKQAHRLSDDYIANVSVKDATDQPWLYYAQFATLQIDCNDDNMAVASSAAAARGAILANNTDKQLWVIIECVLCLSYWLEFEANGLVPTDHNGREWFQYPDPMQLYRFMSKEMDDIKATALLMCVITRQSMG